MRAALGAAGVLILVVGIWTVTVGWNLANEVVVYGWAPPGQECWAYGIPGEYDPVYNACVMHSNRTTGLVMFPIELATAVR